jgi:hypothetical protein
MLVDLDAWHQDQKKYELEGLGKTGDSDAAQLPGMLYRPKVSDDYKEMAWPAFKIYNLSKLHGALFRVSSSITRRCQETDVVGDKIVLAAERLHAREERNYRRPTGSTHLPPSRRPRKGIVQGHGRLGKEDRPYARFETGM